MRSAIRIITLALILPTAALTGCGPKDTEPTRDNVNVKDDERIKADFDQALKKKNAHTAVPAK
jgi:predicted small lipoprotein YifL